MDESTFPYTVDERTRLFLSDLVSLLQSHDVRFASHAGGVQVQFQNKGQQRTTVDAPLAFTQDGVQMAIPMNAVAKSNAGALEWLRKYHTFLENSRGESFTAIPQRCNVVVEARVDGQIRYYLTYMVAHEDRSLAQDTPQGKLYKTEALSAPSARKPASQQSEPAGQQEQAVWTTQGE